MVDKNSEKILIIYSAHKTLPTDIEEAKRAVSTFTMRQPQVNTEPFVFSVPEAATPGATLGTELMSHLEESVGAIAFVDDLRPNVAYEMGIFHGKGRAILLATHGPIDVVWTAISDLAGAPLADLNRVSLETAIHSYLTKLYTHLRRVEPLPFQSLPRSEDNLLNQLASPDLFVPNDNGPYGRIIRVLKYEPPIDIPIGVNLSPSARAQLVLRGVDETADYSVYFRVRYKDRMGARRRVWLGITSLIRVAWITGDERQFPGQTLTRRWRLLPIDPADLLRRGSLLGAAPPDYLECIRFRAGTRDRANIAAVEVAFVGLTGVDN